MLYSISSAAFYKIGIELSALGINLWKLETSCNTPITIVIQGEAWNGPDVSVEVATFPDFGRNSESRFSTPSDIKFALDIGRISFLDSQIDQVLGVLLINANQKSYVDWEC